MFAQGRTASLTTALDNSGGGGGGDGGAGPVAGRTWRGRKGIRRRREPPVYAALDLGTNNCRLLLACPQGDGFRVVDAFSRIIRLGEGVARSGRLSEAAMGRAIAALRICDAKMRRRNVRGARLIATEACRVAENGAEFVTRVRAETGLALEIVDRETEAHLAVTGSAPLLDPACRGALVFDIGGGSSELIWVSIERRGEGAVPGHRIHAWTSLPVGVVSLAERFGGVDVSADDFAAMVDCTLEHLAPFAEACRPVAPPTSQMHLLGTSGTVTTIAGVHLGLERYDRAQVDGRWLACEAAAATTRELMAMGYDGRVRSPCIGRERADLVLAGCAILEAIMRTWPCERLRVADRGLREGILHALIAEGRRDGRATGRPADDIAARA